MCVFGFLPADSIGQRPRNENCIFCNAASRTSFCRTQRILNPPSSRRLSFRPLPQRPAKSEKVETDGGHIEVERGVADSLGFERREGTPVIADPGRGRHGDARKASTA